jgi:hypothetical protein
MKRGVNFSGHIHIVHALGHVALVLAAIAGFGTVVMLLWNWLMPAIFGLTAISIWQALGLLALARILFSGTGAGRFGGMGHRRNPFREKWMRMTPDERKEFMRKRPFNRGFGDDFFGEDKTGNKE